MSSRTARKGKFKRKSDLHLPHNKTLSSSSAAVSTPYSRACTMGRSPGRRFIWSNHFHLEGFLPLLHFIRCSSECQTKRLETFVIEANVEVLTAMKSFFKFFRHALICSHVHCRPNSFIHLSRSMHMSVFFCCLLASKLLNFFR